jgi:hypothetical protein
MEKTDSDTLWGCAEIARAINRTQRQTYHLLENKLIPARKVGDHWVASCERLLAFLHGEDDGEPFSPLARKRV